LLPRNEQLISSEKTVEAPATAHVLTPEAREELWNNQNRASQHSNAKKFNNVPKTNGTSNTNINTNGNGIRRPFDDLDDEINLEIEDVGGFY
jgi:hypothetical protein